jgi:hypothetical protein
MNKKLTFPSKATRSDSAERNPNSRTLKCGGSIPILLSLAFAKRLEEKPLPGESKTLLR